MRQRAMISMALACEPKLLIADEPTTALDVTIQAQILEIMKDLKQRQNMSIVLITHDLGIVSDICDKIIIMYSGEIMEYGPIESLYYNPSHPYTIGLIHSLPKIDQKEGEPLTPIEARASRLDAPARRLPVCAALRAVHESLPDREAAVFRNGYRPLFGLLAPLR